MGTLSLAALRWLGGLILLLLMALVGSPPVAAQSSPLLPNSFIIQTVQANGQSMPYAVWLPPDYSPAQQWPVILFLHGGGHRGADGIFPVLDGIGPQLWQNPKRIPCLVVMPQLPSAVREWDGSRNNIALEALEAVVVKYGGDRNRLYLTGLSVGGDGTWRLAAAHPELFAAAMPIAGRGSAVVSVSQVPALKSLPLWVFHGGLDDPTYDRKLVAEIQAEGNPNIQYTEYRGVGHNVWDLAYADPKVIAWLLAQKR
jgi:predicted peptidase